MLSKPQGRVWLKGLGKLKKKLFSSGLEHATFRLVAKSLSPPLFYPRQYKKYDTVIVIDVLDNPISRKSVLWIWVNNTLTSLHHG
jgi:hypothetical protein